VETRPAAESRTTHSEENPHQKRRKIGGILEKKKKDGEFEKKVNTRARGTVGGRHYEMLGKVTKAGETREKRNKKIHS